MKLLMCQSCGEFVRAISEGDSPVPSNDECPNCGGREFKNNKTGERIRTDSSTD